MAYSMLMLLKQQGPTHLEKQVDQNIASSIHSLLIGNGNSSCSYRAVFVLLRKEKKLSWVQFIQRRVFE